MDIENWGKTFLPNFWKWVVYVQFSNEQEMDWYVIEMAKVAGTLHIGYGSNWRNNTYSWSVVEIITETLRTSL